MGLKVSSALDKTLANLRSFAEEKLKEPTPNNRVELTIEQATTLTADYQTTLQDGTERGVTLGDLEAVGNFHRDVHTAGRVINAEVGIPYMEKNADVDSFKTTIALPEIAGHGLTITSAVYRPGKEEEHDNTYSAVTRTWGGSEDDKAIDEHLLGLSSRLKSKKDKK